MWNVCIVGQAKKNLKSLPNGVCEAFATLLLELKHLGPYRITWPNYTKINGKDDYHCHIVKGRPTYVCCWKLANKKQKNIEVYYVGTHEKAPY